MNLSQFGRHGIDSIQTLAQRQRFERGERVYAPGDEAAFVYFVSSGRVKIVRTGAAGGETIVGIRIAGEIFGELSAFARPPRRSAGAIAMEPTEIDAIDAGGFAALAGADVEVARAFARGIAGRLNNAAAELAELAGKSVAGRLVDVLGRLATDHGVEQDDGTVRLALNLTHQDLADLIGTSRETLTKELSVLSDVGLLRVAHKTITLVAPQAFVFDVRSSDAQ